jgi:hypothetical protein
MVHLRHCLIKVGNNLLNTFFNVMNEYIENLSTAEIRLMRALTNYNIIIGETVLAKDKFDKVLTGKKMKLLQVWLALHRKKTIGDIFPPPILIDAAAAIANAEILWNGEEPRSLLAVRQVKVEKLTRTRQLVLDIHKNLCALQSSKAKSVTSLETKIFTVLKGIGIEQSSHHGGSLNGMTIKKVMNNAAYLFEDFSSILKSGKQDDYELSNNMIEALCHCFD